MIDPAAIRARYEALAPHLDERLPYFAPSEARAAGYGGIATVSRVTGIAASTIGRGLNELADAKRQRAGPEHSKARCFYRSRQHNRPLKPTLTYR